MDALTLNAEPRQAIKGHAKNLRKQNLIPAVVYGKGIETRLLQIEEKPLSKVISVAGTHQLISLQVNDQAPIMTLAREIQRDKIRRDFLHIDFLVVNMNEKITAQVPIAIVGSSPAVVDFGGILTQNMDEIEIECFPSDLIAAVEVNISSLVELNDSLQVSDLTVPETVTILSDPDSMVVKVEPPRTVESLEALDEELGTITSAEPEVISGARDDDFDNEG